MKSRNSLISPHLLKIYGTSTASLRKFQSSTYHRYASGWNLLGSLYLHRLFLKVLETQKLAVSKCTRMYIC